jgi:hypothetical protein
VHETSLEKNKLLRSNFPERNGESGKHLNPLLLAAKLVANENPSCGDIPELGV